ncbi:hypothetical protein [Paenirhodobacter ferrireducens]|uniref:hypothetical protein n=1 Tax=Paenirhodobacter ferrireducens TaxID=1215032 RepID=UPI000FE33F7F|nr:hypothetical protein [Sinirhodobacter ferrireducens]
MKFIQIVIFASESAEEQGESTVPPALRRAGRLWRNRARPQPCQTGFPVNRKMPENAGKDLLTLS